MKVTVGGPSNESCEACHVENGYGVRADELMWGNRSDWIGRRWRAQYPVTHNGGGYPRNVPWHGCQFRDDLKR